MRSRDPNVANASCGRSCCQVLVLLCIAALAMGCQQRANIATDRPPTVQTEQDSQTSLAPIDRPLVTPHDGYVSSTACQSCHPNEHATWSASYHRTMTQAAHPQSVIGRFDGQVLNFYGWSFRPERIGDEFWMNIQGSSGSPQFRHKLVMTTGSHHMQKYWYPTGQTRKLGLAPLVYLVEADLWVPEHTAFLSPTESGLPVREGTWNKGCNQCHATGPQPRLFSSDTMDTRVAEFGISCESCHGPAEQHVRAMSEDDELVAKSQHASLAIVNPRKLSPRRSSQVCGQCHGIWTLSDSQKKSWAIDGHAYRPGDDLENSRRYIDGIDDQQLFDEVHAADSFWSDGQIRVAGREYNGLLASPCFTDDGVANGISCISCHDLHAHSREDDQRKAWANDQLASQMKGNDACLQCHGSFQQNLTQHTHHSAGSTGSLCYNCHMPYTSYGLLKAVRSHTITNPSVDTSIQTGRPNACNQCHLDQTLQWTSGHLHAWYGHEMPALSEQQKKYAASLLWAVKGDAGQRALMAWSMGWESAKEASGSNWMVFFLSELMFDDYDAIRYIAVRSLKSFPAFADLEFDHMKPLQQRARIVQEIMTTWQRMISDPPRDARLLFDATGTIRFDTYQALRAERNNRTVKITE